MPPTSVARRSAVRGVEPPKSASAQHHEISRKETSRLLVQLMPMPGGLARSQSRIVSANIRA